jgi:alkylation response protein AidB-like acyl-CoA dehydrogenase
VSSVVSDRPTCSQVELRKHVFAEGIAGERPAAFRRRVRAEIEAALSPLVSRAEAERSFPREAIEHLGRKGILRERWAGGLWGDPGKSVLLAEELGRAGLGGVGVGVSLHAEAALGILTRFAHSASGRAYTQAALDGRQIACLATSEREVGSDLTRVATTLEPEGDGWRVTGRKWFVSPGRKADFAIVLCRAPPAERSATLSTNGSRSGLRIEPLALAIVPRAGLYVEKCLLTTGMRSLETVRLRVDAHIDDELLIGRPGLGLLAVSWGLAHERLALAAQVLGGAELAIGLATAHLYRRRQFGVRLIEHQALRLRLADLAAQVRLARHGVYASTSVSPANATDVARETAGIKVTAARLAERVVSECIHLFGGTGYLEDETPLGRLWRDTRIGRLGAGSDEMMWELVAGGMRPDHAAYDRMMEFGE